MVDLKIKPGDETKAPGPTDKPVVKKVYKKTATKTPKKGPVKFECGFAMPGDSTVAFDYKYNGTTETYNLSLKNKIYILPEKLTKEEVKKYRAALIANNFQDVTVNISAVFDKQTGKTTYKAMHPEQTDRNRINATIAVILKNAAGKPELDGKGHNKVAQVTILEGIVKTDDVRVYDALIKSGFYDAGSKKGAKNVT